MRNKIHRDLSSEAWRNTACVDIAGDFIRLGSGFWQTELKLPITPDLQTCFDSHRIYAPFKYERLFRSAEWISSLDNDLPELSDGLIHLGSASHYHYLIHGIGNLSPSALRVAGRIFVDSDYSDDQIGFLADVIQASAGVRPAVIRVPAGTYRVKNVLIPIARPHPVTVASVRRNIGSLGLARRSDRQRFYVTRRKASRRHLVNENDFIQAIDRNYGFQLVDNDGLSLAEQVALYGGAEFVIGPHGAGLANVIFAERPRGLLEFWHSQSQSFFEGLAHELRILYVAAQGEATEGPSPGPRKDDGNFVVDPDLVLRAVEALVTKAPAT